MGVRILKCLYCGSKKLCYEDTAKMEFTYGPYDQTGIKKVELFRCRECKGLTVIE